MKFICSKLHASSLSPALHVTAAVHLGLEEWTKGRVERGSCEHVCTRCCPVSPLYLGAKKDAGLSSATGSNRGRFGWRGRAQSMQGKPLHSRGDNAEGQTPLSPLGVVSHSPYSTIVATKTLLGKPSLEAPQKWCPHIDAGAGQG